MHCDHLRSPGLGKFLGLWIDRANELELLFAPPAFELFFPSDGCANVFVTLKVEQVFQDGVAANFQPSPFDKLRAVPAGLSLEMEFSLTLFSRTYQQCSLSFLQS
jgi:hypothetical protein